ncbi:MAG: AarF/ABC1/UbiB kinase family protein [Leptospiraceae bacterium]|nr:AarF/ABC1/UbiB kinase family protein [Leptospiraceae bacterium]
MSLFDNIINAMQASVRVLDTVKVFSLGGVDLIRKAAAGENTEAPKALRQAFEDLGATYIKLGQLIASAPGLFPPSFVNEMQKCLDQVRPLPFSEIKKVLEKDFGNRLSEIFSHIDELPLASASIAQVHAATLRTGEDVVIKVQRPGIVTTLNADMNLIYLAAWLFEKIAPGGARASLTEIVNQFQMTIAEETDFLREAANIREFEKFLQEFDDGKVVVPKVYAHATTKNILTMSRLYGVPLTDLDSIRKYTDSPRDTLILAMNTWFSSLMFCGFFHADVHAGNLMVLENGQLAFLDFGIVGRMSEDIWNSLMNLTLAMGTRDYDLMAESLVGINATKGEVDVKKFSAGLKKVFEDFEKIAQEDINTINVNEAEVNEIMMNLVSVAEDNGLKLPREFALLFKQLLYFDRYVQILAPDINVATSKEIIKFNKMKQLK